MKNKCPWCGAHVVVGIVNEQTAEVCSKCNWSNPVDERFLEGY